MADYQYFSLKILALAEASNNKALLKNTIIALHCEKRLYKKYKPKVIDFLLTHRFISLFNARIKYNAKFCSAEVYSGICSRQNYYYRVLLSPERLIWILNQVFSAILTDIKNLDILKLNYAEKSLLMKSGRFNFSEGRRSLERYRLLNFLNFTTKYSYQS